MDKETLLNILNSYLTMISRDNGAHPSAVLSDIEASIKHVLRENNCLEEKQ